MSQKPFVNHYFGVKSKYSSPSARYQDSLLLLYPSTPAHTPNCIVLSFTFMHTMQFQITFVYSVKFRARFFFFNLPMEIELIQHNPLKRHFFSPPLNWFCTFVKIQWSILVRVYLWVINSVLLIYMSLNPIPRLFSYGSYKTSSNIKYSKFSSLSRLF